jgi:hypothetical protein
MANLKPLSSGASRVRSVVYPGDSKTSVGDGQSIIAIARTGQPSAPSSFNGSARKRQRSAPDRP